jgi:hypothetical protein
MSILPDVLLPFSSLNFTVFFWCFIGGGLPFFAAGLFPLGRLRAHWRLDLRVLCLCFLGY